MASPPAKWDWKEYYTTITVDYAECKDVALTIKELEALTRKTYSKTASEALMPADNELVPTDPEEFRKWANKRGRKDRVTRANSAWRKTLKNPGCETEGCAMPRIENSRLCNSCIGDSRLKDIDEFAKGPPLDENANPILDQSLTAHFIDMKKAAEPEDWTKTFEILYGEDK